MPNWCKNQVTIEGKPSTIMRLLEKAKPDNINGHFSLENLVPCPHELRQMSARSDYDMYYDAKYTDKWRDIANYPWVLEKTNGALPSREWLVKFLEEERPDSVAGGEQIRKNVEKYGFRTWYDWSVASWGTKWDIEAFVEHEFGDNSCVLIFDSAWSPPLEAFKTISREWNLKITAEYYEYGMNFVGVTVFKNGTVIEDREGKIDLDYEKFEFCPEYNELCLDEEA